MVRCIKLNCRFHKMISVIKFILCSTSMSTNLPFPPACPLKTQRWLHGYQSYHPGLLRAHSSQNPETGNVSTQSQNFHIPLSSCRHLPLNLRCALSYHHHLHWPTVPFKKEDTPSIDEYFSNKKVFCKTNDAMMGINKIIIVDHWL